MTTIPQLIRRWEMCNNHTFNYGTYEMRDLERNIRLVIYRENIEKRQKIKNSKPTTLEVTDQILTLLDKEIQKARINEIQDLQDKANRYRVLATDEHDQHVTDMVLGQLRKDILVRLEQLEKGE